MNTLIAPLRGIRVLELAGLAPAPMAGLMLRHAGAAVVRIDRCGGGLPDVLGIGKRSIALDWKTPTGQDVLCQLIERADVLLDPFRPGALEAAGFTEQRLASLNRGLVVARITGYGQSGPLSRVAGHDINYVAAAGVLSLLCRPGQPPQVPLNLLADFSAGSALAVSGIAMALFDRSRTGRGSFVDVNMAAGTAYLASLISNLQREGLWEALPFLAPGSAPWYDVYRTSDGRWVAVGALEPQFYALLMQARRACIEPLGRSCCI
jgi:alpha-methylacyl-CoA racemase